MSFRSRSRAAGLAALTVMTGALVTSAPAAAAQHRPQVRVVADHLNNPRQMFITGGTLYVAEAGAGGPDCPAAFGGHACFGYTSSITRISAGSVERVVTGLVSVGNADGTFAVGADSAALRGDALYMPMAFLYGAPIPAKYLAQLGHVMRSQDGGLSAWANVSSWEIRHPANSYIDSNPYGSAVLNGHIYVVDAAANDLLELTPDGIVRIAHFTKPEYDPKGVQDVVPTSVVAGPDGALYVGELGGGGTPKNGSRVWRVVPGAQPEVYRWGFNSISGLAFGPDGSLYVCELQAVNGTRDPRGDIIRVRPDGSRTQLGYGSLFFPGGVAVDAQGRVFASNFAVAPANGAPSLPPGVRGQVVQVNY